MAVNTLQQIFDSARGYLHDVQISGGEVWNNAALQTHFNEPYRRMVNQLMGLSKRIQRSVYVTLPANTTVLIPSDPNYNILDFSGPELIEERPASALVPLSGTTPTNTPISVTATSPHGFGPIGSVAEIIISGIPNTTAAWGQWFATITSANNFTLNGSVQDGVTGGVGGFASLSSVQQFTEVVPADLPGQCIDGTPNQRLGCYLWANNQLQFRGAINPVQLRITYWASGTPPTNVNLNIAIDNCIDFLACATAANAARANNWMALATELKATAYGPTQQASDIGGLLGEFIAIQVKQLQGGPQRRQGPFRPHISRFGNYCVR